jgi:2-keto-4-pentenoate hydratase
LLAHCRARGIDLPAGTVVTTGSNTGLVLVDPGGLVTLEDDGLALVTVQF